MNIKYSTIGSRMGVLFKYTYYNSNGILISQPSKGTRSYLFVIVELANLYPK